MPIFPSSEAQAKEKHKNLRTSLQYAQIINKKVANDMAVLKEKLEGVENKNQTNEA